MSRWSRCADVSEAPAFGSCRSVKPSAASPIEPVTNSTSPARAPLRRTMVPLGSVPTAVIDTDKGPGVWSVSPPSKGQP